MAQLTTDKSFFNDEGHDDEANGVLLPSMLSHVGLKQQSDAAQTAVAQLMADKSFFNDWLDRQDEATNGVLLPSMLSHVGVVQHSFPLSAQKVQTVDVVVPVLAEESGQVTASLLVLFLPHLPHAASREQVPVYMSDPG